MIIAGIDGGGTHTRLELRATDNRLLERLEFGPFNLNAIGEAAFRGRLQEVFAACGNMEDCEKLCVGGAGISNPDVGRILSEELERAREQSKGNGSSAETRRSPCGGPWTAPALR